MEASTNQVAEQQMPAYDLPSKILCRVVHVHLKVCLSDLVFQFIEVEFVIWLQLNGLSSV